MGVLDTLDVVIDNVGMAVHPDVCSHVYGYDTSGNLTTDTITDPSTGVVHVKTFTYAGGLLTAESVWVKQ